MSNESVKKLIEDVMRVQCWEKKDIAIHFGYRNQASVSKWIERGQIPRGVRQALEKLAEEED